MIVLPAVTMTDWPDLHKGKYLPFIRGTNHDDAVARFIEKYQIRPRWIVLTLDDYQRHFKLSKMIIEAGKARPDGVIVIWSPSARQLIYLGPIPGSNDD